MSILRLTTLLSTALAAVMLLASPALAQREIKHVPPLIDPDGYDPDVYQPFIEPDLFNPDYQFFAPADFSEFGRGEEAHVGWFATYDRLRLWITRPEDQVGQGVFPSSPTSVLADGTGGDWAWGNRFDVGYMTTEDHGWLASFWNMDGPHHRDGPEVERVDVFQQNDPNSDPNTTVVIRGGGAAGGGGAMNVTAGFTGQPDQDLNDPVTGARDYRIQNSINVADLTSFEFNKTFRVKPLHYGSIVEPFLGFRYMKFSDYFQRDSYQLFSDTTGGPLNPNIPLPGNNTAAGDLATEQFMSLKSKFENHMVGGQLGVRWFKRKQKWNLSSELRAFAFQNFQSLGSVLDTETTVYTPPAGIGATVTRVFNDRVRNSGNAAEFVVGTEIRAQAAYALTRDFWVRGGVTFMEFGRGIGRGNNINRNDQDLTMIGGSLGFEYNR